MAAEAEHRAPQQLRCSGRTPTSEYVRAFRHPDGVEIGNSFELGLAGGRPAPRAPDKADRLDDESAGFSLLCNGHGRRYEKNGVVCAVEPEDFRFYRPEEAFEIDPFDISEMGFFYPPGLAPRIVAQRGLFSVHAQPQRAWSLTPADQFLLPRLLKDEFRRMLFTLGVDEAQLMADLDGLTKTLKWRYVNGIPLE